MTEPSLATTKLHEQIERLRAGDRAAQDELIQAVAARMRRIAQHMLRAYPGVRAAADTDDVLQNTLLRLLAALGKIRPTSTRDFFQLAAHLTRQELIDLLRRHARRRTDELPAQLPQPDEQLDAWLHFHEAVERLPDEEREVMSLTFYHGWTQEQIAAVIGVTPRTVRRRWAAGCLKLRETLAEELDALFQ